jgi:hypothetical protein
MSKMITFHFTKSEACFLKGKLFLSAKGRKRPEKPED